MSQFNFAADKSQVNGWQELELTDGWGRRDRDYYVKHGKLKRLFVKELCKNARRSLQAQHLKPALAMVEDKVAPRCTQRVEQIRPLGVAPPEQKPQPLIERALHHYFAYRVELNRLEFRHLMQDGRRSLLTGLLFLAACLTVSRFLVRAGAGTFPTLARESLAIAGWVAMWRPMEI